MPSKGACSKPTEEKKSRNALSGGTRTASHRARRARRDARFFTTSHANVSRRSLAFPGHLAR